MAVTEGPDGAIELFRTNAERAASLVHDCPTASEVIELVKRFAGDGPVSVSGTVTRRHPEIVRRLEAEFQVLRPERPEIAAEATVGVSAGEALVVETGSVLVSERELPDRLVSMLSPILVQVVSADAILTSLDEVGALLSERHAGGIGGYHALITGPSRSADIERSLTIGVQGPSEVHIAILMQKEGDEVS